MPRKWSSYQVKEPLIPEKAIEVYAPLRGEPDLVLRDGTCWPVAFSPDGKTLSSGSADKTIKLWDVPAGKQADQ